MNVIDRAINLMFIPCNLTPLPDELPTLIYISNCSGNVGKLRGKSGNFSVFMQNREMIGKRTGSTHHLIILTSSRIGRKTENRQSGNRREKKLTIS